MQKLFCSTHGSIDDFYDKTCPNCLATMKKLQSNPKLNSDTRILDGTLQTLRDGAWANPFDRVFARWQ
jgi:hypothetical protein